MNPFSAVGKQTIRHRNESKKKSSARIGTARGKNKSSQQHKAGASIQGTSISKRKREKCATGEKDYKYVADTNIQLVSASQQGSSSCHTLSFYIHVTYLQGWL